MGLMETLFGGSETKYKGGYNPNKEIWEDFRKPTLEELYNLFGGRMTPPKRSININMDGQTFSRYHPDYKYDWEVISNLLNWGPIEHKYPETKNSPGLLPILGAGLALMKHKAPAGSLAAGF